MPDVDFIIPWVDGKDPVWLSELFAICPERKCNFDAERYRDWDLLKYWFRGIEKNAGWVRKIHFITYGHVPDWLDITNTRINIVRHEDFIQKDYLPLFSASPIEINVGKINGLADNFVYFNDDMFLIDYVKKSDFFKNGLPCDIGVFNTLSPGGISHMMLNDLEIIKDYFKKETVIRSNFLKWINLKYGSKLYRTLALLPWPGFTGFYEHHLPQAYLKSTFDDVWALEENKLNKTLEQKFRSDAQLNIYLFRYWQLCSGKFSPFNYNKIGRYYSLKNDDISNVCEVIRRKKYKVITLNDNAELDFDFCKSKLLKAFEEILSVKSSFEI